MSISSDSVSRNAVVLALGASALACSNSDPATTNDPHTYAKIDDMEGTSGRIEWTPENVAPDAVPGRWISYASVQCNDLEPVPEAEGGTWSYAALPEGHQTMPGVTSIHAARLRTTAPLKSTWGAGMGFLFSELPAGTETIAITRPCTV